MENLYSLDEALSYLNGEKLPNVENIIESIVDESEQFIHFCENTDIILENTKETFNKIVNKIKEIWRKFIDFIKDMGKKLKILFKKVTGKDNILITKSKSLVSKFKSMKDKINEAVLLEYQSCEFKYYNIIIKNGEVEKYISNISKEAIRTLSHNYIQFLKHIDGYKNIDDLKLGIESIEETINNKKLYEYEGHTISELCDKVDRISSIYDKKYTNDASYALTANLESLSKISKSIEAISNIDASELENISKQVKETLSVLILARDNAEKDNDYESMRYYELALAHVERLSRKVTSNIINNISKPTNNIIRYLNIDHDDIIKVMNDNNNKIEETIDF